MDGTVVSGPTADANGTWYRVKDMYEMVRKVDVQYLEPFVQPTDPFKNVLWKGAKYTYTPELRKLTNEGARGQYLFHATPKANLRDIQKDGLIPTDTLWTSRPASYACESYAQATAWGGSSATVLRIAKTPDWISDPETSNFYTHKTVPPKNIQVLLPTGWVSIRSVAAA